MYCSYKYCFCGYFAFISNHYDHCDLYIYIYRFIEVWQPKAGLHTDNQYIHAYNADRNNIEIGLLKIN